MNLQFDTNIMNSYKSPSQRVRVMSETWVANNLYCPCCGNSRIKKLANNRPVSDFVCQKCGEIFELKSQKGKIKRKIPGGAYSVAIKRVTEATNPGLFILSYDHGYNVIDLIFIPKFFFTFDIIEKRKPLPPTARRAGWVGSNILQCNVPDQGKISMIINGYTADIGEVVTNYMRIKTLQISNVEARGWVMDVLNCINSIHGDNFKLSDVYKFEGKLSLAHPRNHNIKAKIRQQLQILRDKGLIEFCGHGCYSKIH